MEAAISVRGLSASYDGHEVLHDVSFEIDRATFAGIIGPNGAGKSTLIKAMLGLVPKDGGDIAYFGRPMRRMRKQIAYVPQRKEVDWDFPISVMETVLLGTYPNLKLFRRPGPAERHFASLCLERVGMLDKANTQIGELSGGQQQRVFIARALAQRPHVLLLDEPFAGIDVRSEETIMDILGELQADGKTMLVVHHDLSKIRRYFHQIILLNKRVIAHGPPEQCFNRRFVTAAYESQLAIFDEPEGAFI